MSQKDDLSVFHRQAHFYGRLTLWAVILTTMIPPLYLSFVLGYHPGWGVVLTAFLGVAAFVGVMWILEPISYFPSLGISGTYMSFLVGNISNMCLPCSAAAQNAVNAEPGSKKAELAATAGIAGASLVHIVVLVPIVLGGAFIVSILPPAIQTAFQYVLPAIFGGVTVQFAMKRPIYGIIGVFVGIVITLLPISSFIKVILCVSGTIAIMYLYEKYKQPKEILTEELSIQKN
ncbi:small-conductance mechanosensitive channel [Fictibacillus sp. S7]|uniref:small-conductance mechanosensitive channel n=1 Tax=Fictibacillus sp. S7 TaxID=2212476 RepID=UPI00101300CE|nr:small-conductance mechanosensitive channel [Fictibacillus sp. S7]RXZ00704.1 small-conductance mechanosensitive channel [Fictibacillus sp. S7]